MNDYLSKLEKLCKKTTPGPWEVAADDGWPIGSFSTGNSGNNGKDYSISCVGHRASDLYDSGAMLDAKNDAEFIAESRTAIPRLIKTLRHYEKRLSNQCLAKTYMAGDVINCVCLACNLRKETGAILEGSNDKGI